MSLWKSSCSVRIKSHTMKGYFDYNATTPLHPAAKEAWLLASERFWYNASSLYREAATVKRRLEDARGRLAEQLGCEPERIVFTSGATESNNALFRVLSQRAGNAANVVSSGVEHPSVREPLQKEFAGRVRLIRTLPDSSLDEDDFAEAIQTANVALVSVIAANNECGTLLPWQKLAALSREKGIPFHTDATQWIGKMSARELDVCDYVTGSAHKFGGPKGIGFLVMRTEDEALSFLRGGPQEEGRRAGTENYPAIEAMVTALEAVTSTLPNVSEAQAKQRDVFTAKMEDVLEGTRVIGASTARLWNTVMLVLPRHDNRKWLARLSDRGFAISTGSACSAGHDGSSVVLQALGASFEEMRRVVRVSGGWETSAEDWSVLAEAFAEVATELDSPPARPVRRNLPHLKF